MAKKTYKRKPKRKSPMSGISMKMITVALLFLVAGSLAVYAFGGSIYMGGWETTTSLGDIKVDNETYNIRNQPEDSLTWGAFEATFDADGDIVEGDTWDGHGLPDLTFSLTYPREYIINDYGEWQTAVGGQVFDEVMKKAGTNTVYFWDHHVFFFEFSISAEPEGTPAPFEGNKGDSGGSSRG